MKPGWLSGLMICAASASLAACKKTASSTADPGDGGLGDMGAERGPLRCPEVDQGLGLDAGAAGAGSSADEFGPNITASKTATSLGRVNFYEVTTPSWLRRVDVYLLAGLEHTRLTLAVHESTGRDSPFNKLFDVQLDFGTCEGWASTGALAIPLEAGRFYAIGFDPNQVITPFVSSDPDSLPIDGAFGRLVGSKTSTSVSLATLAWDKSSDKEFNRQRLTTAPRTPSDASVTDATASPDAGVTDARDADTSTRS